MRALESGGLDAFEWVGPYDDEKFGDRKDGAEDGRSPNRALLLLSRLVEGRHADAFRRVEGEIRRAAEVLSGGGEGGGRVANRSMLEKYDANNPAALKRLAIGGAQLRLFPQEAIEACYKTATDLYGQLSAENPRFKKIADAYFVFRSDQYLWWQVAEYSFDNFMIRQRRAHS